MPLPSRFAFTSVAAPSISGDGSILTLPSRALQHSGLGLPESALVERRSWISCGTCVEVCPFPMTVSKPSLRSTCWNISTMPQGLGYLWSAAECFNRAARSVLAYLISSAIFMPTTAGIRSSMIVVRVGRREQLP